MKKVKSYLPVAFFLVTLFAISGCKPKLNELTFDCNGLDFSNYVAVGTEATAGYMNGALYQEGQENSLAAILAKQFSYTDRKSVV